MILDFSFLVSISILSAAHIGFGNFGLLSPLLNEWFGGILRAGLLTDIGERLERARE
jgi:hypothetical protein